MVALTAATLSSDVNVVGPLFVDYGDLFESRMVLADVPYTVTGIDVVNATMESGEPNPQSVTKTVWVEIAIPTEMPEKLIFSLTPPAGSTGRINVFRQPASEVDVAEPVDAKVNTLVSVAGGAGPLTVTTDGSYPSYYVQVGLKTGTGAGGFTLSVASGDPQESGTFASGEQTDGDWGSTQVDTTNAVLETGEPVPEGITPTGSAWAFWTTDDLPPAGVGFKATWKGTTGTVGLAVYTGSAVNALTPVAGASSVVSASTGKAQVSFAPAANTTYAIQVTATDSAQAFDLKWVPAPEVQDPAVMFDYVRVEVYEADGVTKVTELPRRRGVSFREPLNTPGTGQVSVPLRDEVLQAYPGLLKTGKIVKFFMGNKCVSAFRIQSGKTVYVSAGEHSGMWRSVAGPTVHFLLADFLVKHDGPSNPDSLDTRSYSWASRPGDWFDPNEWDDPTNASTQVDPPGDFRKPAKKRRKYGEPKKWPDPKSQWLWFNGGAGAKWNAGGLKPRRPIAGRRYYRKNFIVPKDGTHVRLFVTADENVTVFIDGEEILKKPGRDTGYRSFARTEMTLARGSHTVAILHRQFRKSRKSDGADAMMFTLFEVDEKGNRGNTLVRSNANWDVYYGNNVPGWRRSQVLRNCVFEARDRGNATASALALGFDGTLDSAGKKWGKDKFSQEIQIGSSALDLQAQLSEGGGFDVWVDPKDLKLHAYKHRGANRSASVALLPGVSLVDWEVEDLDDITNVFFIKHDGGFTTVKAPGAIKDAGGEREAYVELGGVKDDGTARRLMRGVIRGVENAVQRAGSPDIRFRREISRDGGLVGVRGAYPFLDFNVGDVVSAPGSDGEMIPMRVLSITATEDDQGNLSFDPELEAI